MTLKSDSNCGSDPAVDKISHDAPGKVSVAGLSISLKNLPKSSTDPILTQNNHVPSDGVKSFQLEGKGGSICVTHLETADKIHIK